MNAGLGTRGSRATDPRAPDPGGSTFEPNGPETRPATTGPRAPTPRGSTFEPNGPESRPAAAGAAAAGGARRRVGFVDTTIRDGNQSLWSATGLTTPDVLAIAATLDRVG